MTGEQLFSVVEEYAALGEHRTGTTVDTDTIAWMAAQLSALGAKEVQRDEYAFDRYDVAWEVRIDGEPVVSIPLFYEGVGAVRNAVPATASLAVEAGSSIPEFAAFAERALAEGQRAAVVATQTGTGLLCAVNRRVHIGGGLPTVCIAGDLGPRLDGSAMEVDIDARIVPATSTNLMARIGDGIDEDRVLLTTPLSGWFRCAGERGTGIAVMLAVARSLVADDVPITILVTNGHELGGLGVHHHLERAAGPEKAVFHFGASVASGASDAKDRPAARTRQLRPSAWAGDARRSELAEALAPLGVAVRLPTDAEARSPSGWVGESAAWAPLGKPLVSIAGGFPLHHAPEDLPHLATTPALLEGSFAAALAAARVLSTVDAS